MLLVALVWGHVATSLASKTVMLLSCVINEKFVMLNTSDVHIFGLLLVMVQ